MTEQEIQELSIGEFKERYGQLIKLSTPNAAGYALGKDEAATDVFDNLLEGTARFILRTERSTVAEAAVLFDIDGNEVMEMAGYVIRGPGAFYEASVQKGGINDNALIKNDSLKRIYESLEKNPVS